MGDNEDDHYEGGLDHLPAKYSTGMMMMVTIMIVNIMRMILEMIIIVACKTIHKATLQVAFDRMTSRARPEEATLPIEHFEVTK